MVTTKPPELPHVSRRQLLKSASLLGLSTATVELRPVWANAWGQTQSYSAGTAIGPNLSLAIRRESLPVAGNPARPITINHSSPGPLIRLREGEDAVLSVTNLLEEPTSI